jgi:hypothetical protein
LPWITTEEILAMAATSGDALFPTHARLSTQGGKCAQPLEAILGLLRLPPHALSLLPSVLKVANGGGEVGELRRELVEVELAAVFDRAEELEKVLCANVNDHAAGRALGIKRRVPPSHIRHHQIFRVLHALLAVRAAAVTLRRWGPRELKILTAGGNW